MSRLQIEVLNIDDIKLYENNAKLHPQSQIEQIKRSIQDLGYNDPIAVDEHNRIIEGHGRLQALKELGWESVEVIRLTGLNESQKRAYILAHNKLCMNTGYNPEILAQELAFLADDNFDISYIDFSDDFTYSDESQKEAKNRLEKTEEELEDAPQVDERLVFTQIGDLYEIGNHRLLCGDSFKLDNVSFLMNNNKANMVLTDPPYNVSYVGKTQESLTIQNDSMSDKEFYDFLFKIYSNLLVNTKSGGAIYVFHADSEGSNFRQAMKDSGWLLKQCLIWVKNCMVMGRQDYHWKHEPILYGWAPGAAHNWYTDRTQTTVLNFDRPQRSTEHPTMKPINILEYLIKNSSKAEDIVLDLFGGSGSTMVAAEQSQRIAFLNEIDPRYCDVIVKRMIKLYPDLEIKRNGEVFQIPQ